MPLNQTPQQRILRAIAGVAEELLLDVAHETYPPRHASAQDGALYFFRAGGFDAVASLRYEFQAGGMSTLTFTNGTTPRAYAVDAAEAQRTVDDIAAALMHVVGADPLLTSVRPRTSRT